MAVEKGPLSPQQLKTRTDTSIKTLFEQKYELLGLEETLVHTKPGQSLDTDTQIPQLQQRAAWLANRIPLRTAIAHERRSRQLQNELAATQATTPSHIFEYRTARVNEFVAEPETNPELRSAYDHLRSRATHILVEPANYREKKIDKAKPGVQTTEGAAESDVVQTEPTPTSEQEAELRKDYLKRLLPDGRIHRFKSKKRADLVEQLVRNRDGLTPRELRAELGIPESAQGRNSLSFLARNTRDDDLSETNFTILGPRQAETDSLGEVTGKYKLIQIEAEKPQLPTILYDEKKGEFTRDSGEVVQFRGNSSIKELLRVFKANPGKYVLREDLTEKYKSLGVPRAARKVAEDIARLRKLLGDTFIHQGLLISDYDDQGQFRYRLNANIRPPEKTPAPLPPRGDLFTYEELTNARNITPHEAIAIVAHAALYTENRIVERRTGDPFTFTIPTEVRDALQRLSQDAPELPAGTRSESIITRRHRAKEIVEQVVGSSETIEALTPDQQTIAEWIRQENEGLFQGGFLRFVASSGAMIHKDNVKDSLVTGVPQTVYKLDS